MHEDVRRLNAPPDRSLHLWFEPWGDGLAFAAGCVIELRATSPVPGALEVADLADRTAIYAWPGSTLQIIKDGKLVHTYDVAAPDTPSGMSTREFVTTSFGEPPVPPKRVVYNGAEMNEGWPERIEEAQTTTDYSIGGVAFPRVPYGLESGGWDFERPCHDCRVVKGQLHVPSCDVEQCPACGEQAITCDCPREGDKGE